jgi:hypothetical protein
MVITYYVAEDILAQNIMFLAFDFHYLAMKSIKTCVDFFSVPK